jgi:hypothetical protein
MKAFRLCVATTLLVAGLCATFVGTGNAAAPNWAAPNWNSGDLSGDWYGQFASGWDRTRVGEAAMRVDFQDRNRFQGKLAMGRSSWEISGAVDAFNNLRIVGIDPPQADMPGAIIAIRGSVRFADPPSESDPPGEADPPTEIVAEYMIVYSDGSMDMGYLELVPAVRAP